MDDGEVLALLNAQLLFEEGGGQTVPPRLVRVRGRAATGKSTLLQEVARRVRAHYQHHGSALVVAPTKNAANAVQGKTLHSGFYIPWTLDGEVAYSDLEEPQLQSLRDSLDGLQYVLIDNAQQCNNQALFFADRRLRQVFSGEDNPDVPFGGRYVYLFEDERSWGPVPSIRHSMHHSIRDGFTSMYLNNTWLSDVSFCETLRRLRKDLVTQQDVDRMEARHMTKLTPATRQAFSKAITVVGSQDFSINSSHLDALDGSPTDFGDVTLKIGARVVLTAPLGSVPAGSTGVVEDLAGGQVLVRFDSVPDPVIVPPNTPLILGWAVNLAKAMGLRFDKVVVELPDSVTWAGDPTYLYAALSRAKGWSGLALRGNLQNLPQVNENED